MLTDASERRKVAIECETIGSGVAEHLIWQSLMLIFWIEMAFIKFQEPRDLSSQGKVFLVRSKYDFINEYGIYFFFTLSKVLFEFIRANKQFFSLSEKFLKNNCKRNLAKSIQNLLRYIN